MGVKPKDPYLNFALRGARLDADYTRNELADEVGVHQTAISAYERLRAMPGPDIAARIARALGRKISELFPRNLRGIVEEINYERRSGFMRDVPSKNLEDLSEEDLTIEEDFISRVYDSELKSALEKVLNTLTFREREIVKLTHGIEDGYCFNVGEISMIFKITEDRVRQLYKKAIEKLQHPVRTRFLKAFVKPEAFEEVKNKREKEGLQKIVIRAKGRVDRETLKPETREYWFDTYESSVAQLGAMLESGRCRLSDLSEDIREIMENYCLEKIA